MWRDPAGIIMYAGRIDPIRYDLERPEDEKDKANEKEQALRSE
jgi:hypothetical protein